MLCCLWPNLSSRWNLNGFTLVPPDGVGGLVVGCVYVYVRVDITV